MSARVDHLVVAAHTLEQGAAWCERVLGVAPAAGGKHATMGTHNRLMAIGSAVFPMAYLEIIAHDPAAPPPQRPRWFGLDDAALLTRLRERPRLLHVVARCTRLDATLEAWRALRLDAGQAVAAERASPQGLYRWRIAGRADGRLLCGGALPMASSRLCVPIVGCLPPAEGATPSTRSHQAAPCSSVCAATTRWSTHALISQPRHGCIRPPRRQPRRYRRRVR